jgi:hypothetical protein
MRGWRVRQRIGEFFRRDYLEGTIVVFGVIVLALAVFSSFLTVYTILHYSDRSGTFQANTSWLKGTSAALIVFFGLLAGMCWIAAWGLVGKRVYRSLRTRRES